MNPPFGTKNNEGIDVKLLSAAIRVSRPQLLSSLLGLFWPCIFSAQGINLRLHLEMGQGAAPWPGGRINAQDLVRSA